MSKLFAIIALALVAAAVGVQAKDNSWEFMMITQRWPATACDQRHSGCSVPSDVDYFTLHGLWPERNSGYPSFCSNGKVTEKDLDPILTELQEYWTNYFVAHSQKQALSFWQHEYEKHGSCATDVYPTVRDYFQAGIDAQQKYDWKQALANHGIKPSNTKTYTYDALVKAANAEFGGENVVKCDYTKLGQVVAQVVTCVSKEGAVVKCTGVSSNCHKSTPIYMPIIQHGSEDAVSYQSKFAATTEGGSGVGPDDGKDAGNDGSSGHWSNAVIAISCSVGAVAVAAIMGAVWLKNKREERSMGDSLMHNQQAA